MSTYCFGDVHGEFDKLKKCIESVNLKGGDKLISLGDLVDRGPDSYKVIEYCIELSKQYECYFIKGNHDVCWFDYLKTGNQNVLWSQGGRETYHSYEGIDPKVHFDFFAKQIPYYIDKDLNLFIHGGFNRHFVLESQDEDIFLWDRDLLAAARSYSSMKDIEYPFKIKGCIDGQFKEIFLGHTPCQYFESNTPLNYANIWVLDTGAGKMKKGTVTVMNVETKEYFQV